MLLGIVVLLATGVWAFAFQSIYIMKSRIAASRWIFQNAPGPINLKILAEDGSIPRTNLCRFPGN